MSELEEKLENILGNPQAMSQIMALAQSLNLSGGQTPAGDGSPEQTPPQTQPQPAQNAAPPAASAPASTASSDGLGGLLGGLSSLDPKLLSAAAGLMGQYVNSGNDDERVALLNALRPFVKEQRYAKLDKAIQIAKLSRLIRSGLELFRVRKEDGHV